MNQIDEAFGHFERELLAEQEDTDVTLSHLGEILMMMRNGNSNTRGLAE